MSSRLRNVVLGSIVGLALGAPLALANGLDPTLPSSLVVGAPRGASPMARTDAQRTGRAEGLLPSAPRVLWRKLTHAALELLPVAVDERGSIVFAGAGAPEVAQLAADGALAWRTRTGSGPPVTGPVLTSDGTRVVVTSAGEVFGITPAGEVRFRTDLGVHGRTARLAPLPLRDGGVAIAAGSELALLDGDGNLRSRIPVGERIVGALVSAGPGVVATTETGGVYLVRPPGPARRLGTFGGDVGAGAALADPRTLLAVVDSRRVAAFDLATGTAHARYAAPSASLDGPLAIARDAAFATSFGGVLLGWSATGQELARVPLDVRSQLSVPDGGAMTLGSVAESPPLIADREGRIAFARVGGRIGVVSPDGAPSLVVGTACQTPVALAPAGERRMVVACRDGVVLLLGD